MIGFSIGIEFTSISSSNITSKLLLLKSGPICIVSGNLEWLIFNKSKIPLAISSGFIVSIDFGLST